MSGWRNIPVGELVEPVVSWNPLRASQDEEFDYIDLSAVDQNTKTILAPRKVTCCEAPSRARQLVAANDVLVSTVRPNLNGVASVPVELDQATASTGFCVLRPRSNKLGSSYLFHWVKSPQFVSDMVKKATGASYPAVSDKIIFESLIPVPPLPEQIRIAAILDQADALRVKRREALAQLDSLTQSIFIEMFGSIDINPKGFPVIELGSVVKVIGGFAFKSEDFAENGCAIIRISNLTGDGIDLSKAARIPQSKLGKGKGYQASPGDILIAMSGATTGKLGVVPHDIIEELYQNQRVGNFKIINGEKIQKHYLLALLRSDYYQKFIWSLAWGAAQPNVSSRQLESALIPLPPLQLQHEFGKRVSAIVGLTRTFKSSIGELDNLFTTLQYRAFRGEL